MSFCMLDRVSVLRLKSIWTLVFPIYRADNAGGFAPGHHVAQLTLLSLVTAIDQKAIFRVSLGNFVPRGQIVEKVRIDGLTGLDFNRIQLASLLNYAVNFMASFVSPKIEMWFFGRVVVALVQL